MENMVIDRAKAIEIAKELGLKVSFDSHSTGVVIKSDDKEHTFDFVAFFPEMSLLVTDTFVNVEKFVTKEEGFIEGISSNLRPTNVEIKEVKIIEVDSSTFSKSSHLIGAA